LLWSLIPALGDEVDQTWRRSAGSSTAVGTTTTLVDSQQDWEVNQWVGAKLRMTGGRRSGTVVTVTANTATVLTFTPAFGGNVKIDQPYEVINPPVLARMRDGDRLTITYDDSGLVIGALSAGINIYDESTRLWIGGGKDTSAVLAGQRRSAIEIGQERRLLRHPLFRRTRISRSLMPLDDPAPLQCNSTTATTRLLIPACDGGIRMKRATRSQRQRIADSARRRRAGQSWRGSQCPELDQGQQRHDHVSDHAAMLPTMPNRKAASPVSN
jgi:hypothetical protein